MKNGGRSSCPACSLTILISMIFGAFVFYCFILFSQDSLPAHAPLNPITKHVIRTEQAEAGEEAPRSLLNNEEELVKHYKAIRPPLIESPTEGLKSIPWRTLYDVVTEWSPDNPDIPPEYKETLQHFNYMDPEEREMALRWRKAELPFKVFNIPEFTNVVNLWSDDYLTEQLGKNPRPSHVEKSKDNHFMFWSGRGKGLKNFVPPTEIIKMPFPKWLELAYKAEREKWGSTAEHFYFMSSADRGDRHNTFVARDLPMFSSGKETFWVWKPKANKGIQCRFGMRGVIAESHYDSGRNMIAMLKGNKRYIINPPEACSKLGIIADTKHPSYRHSVFDWSDPLQAKAHNFEKADGIDTILRAGEVLYVPSYWFHYMVSLNYSVQCNSRSGAPESEEGWDDIQQCFKDINSEHKKEEE